MSLRNEVDVEFDTRLIVLLDEKTFQRDCTLYFLRSLFDGEQVVAFSNAQEFVGATAARSFVGLIFLDAGSEWPNRDNVRSQLSLLQKTFIDGKIVIMFDGGAVDGLAHELNDRLRGFLPRTIGLEIATHAIRLIDAGGTYVPATSIFSSNTVNGNEKPQVSGLTPQQIRILQSLCRGMSNKQIARDFLISESTVKVHVRAIMKKLQVSNRTQAAVRARALIPNLL